MAQSDITIDALSKVGQQDAEYLVSLVRSVPGFPKEGIIFRDFMPVLADPKGLKILLKALEEALPVSPSEFDSIAGLESRGFLFGPAMAAHLGKGFIAVRKAGKLPPETIGESYDLEYGTASVEIETDAYRQGSECSSSMTSSPRAAPPKPPPTLSKRPVAPWWASVS
ncbi:Adenine phosphoribosyltransferase [Bifidobacterium longum subsp. longum]|nr:Adenine phosphoribosyltransferase [Bifidobacterium longum subsp. longum]